MNSSRSLLAILNDILDYSKIEARHIELEAVDFSVEAVLRSTSDLFSIRAEEKGLELFLDIRPEVPDQVVGDALRLNQIISNLVGNAIKFTERGEVCVRVDAVRQDAQEVVLRVAVRDTGIGITADQAARLFQPFSQADASVTRRFGGTGLGLTISKRLIQLMGGEIELSSEPGQGSTFAFTVRLGRATGKQAARTAKPGLQRLRPVRTLVADDNPTSLIILRSLLERWHFEVCVATSGEEAVQCFAEAEDRGAPFELLLLDWKMPGMNGLETARAIAQATRSRIAAAADRRPPPSIIMVTAYGPEALTEEIEASGSGAHELAIEAVISKPVTPSTLLDALLRSQNGKARPSAEPVGIFERNRATLAPIRGAHVLLVEDNELNQQVAREFLAKGGLQVTVASNGEQALERLAAIRFDAILMDLHMPVMDGLEAARRIRQLPAYRELPIIAMTAAAMPGDRRASAAAGMNDHIAKPVDPQELAETLLRWIAPQAPSARDDSVPAAKDAENEDGCSDTLIEAFEAALPGVAVRSSLARMGGNAALYRQLLQSFADRHQRIGAHLAQLCTAGELERLHLEAHNLKGEAGNLGFDGLRRLADQLCEAIGRRPPQTPPSPEQLAAVADECARAVALAGQWQAPSASDPAAKAAAGTAATNFDQLLPLLLRLKTRLEVKSLDARHAAAELDARIHGSPLVEELAGIILSVQQLHYGLALASLEQLLERHQPTTTENPANSRAP